MIELIQELDAASSLLSDATQRYIGACHAIKNFYGKTTRLSDVPRALSDRVASEIVSATSYEVNLKRAKSIISQARNYSTNVVPIHSLPTEVLASIFRIVVGARPCDIKVKDSSGNSTSLPKHPDFLSQVCSRWRQVAVGVPELWTHVDVVMYHSLNLGFVTRAEICAARAGDLPLDVHIRVPASHGSRIDDWSYTFLKSIGPRTRSLELVIPRTFTYFDESVLDACLPKIEPSIFTRLTITDSGIYAPQFIAASLSPQSNDLEDSEYDSLQLSMPSQCFEDSLRPVTSLRLDGLYPRWTSQVYHGLVELRLTSARAPELNVQITQAKLHNILTYSPMLRIIEFGLEITDPLSENTSDWQFLPVRLENLEILNLGPLVYEQLKIFLSLIDPGLKPLQLTVQYNDNMSLLAHDDEVVKFFKRSRITKLHAKALSRPPEVRFDELLSRDRFPHLQALALDSFESLQPSPRSSRDIAGRITPLDDLRLDILYLLHCQLELRDIRQLVQQHSPQSLVLWRSDMYQNEEYVADFEIKLSGICPVVESIFFMEPDPIENWDRLD